MAFRTLQPAGGTATAPVAPAALPTQGFRMLKAAVAPEPAAPPERSFLQKTGDVAKKVGGFLISNEKNLGESIAGAIIPYTTAQKQFEAAKENISKARYDFVKIVLDRKKKKEAAGQDTSKEDAQLKKVATSAGMDYGDFNPASKKTGKQIAGEALGVAADIASFGTYGQAAKGAQTGKLLVQGAGSRIAAPVLEKAGIRATAAEKVLPTATTKLGAFAQGAKVGAATAAPVGAAYGAAEGLQANEDLPKVVTRALTSGVVSGVLGGVLGGVTNLKNRTPESIRADAIAQYKKGLGATKEKYKEQADKIIPDLLDNEVWGTHKTLTKKAESGIALSREEYQKLGELQGTVETPGLLEGIDKQISDYSQGGRAVLQKNNIIKKTITDHVTMAKEVVDGLDSATIAKEGGMPALIKRAQINIADGLRGEGINDVGDFVDNLDVSKYETIGEFQRQVTKLVDDQFGAKPISVNVPRVTKLKQLKADIEALALYNKPTEAYQQDLRELAQQYGDLIYDTRKSIKTVEDNVGLSQVRKVDLAIRDVLNTQNPEYAKINKVYTLNSRLFDILDETAKRKEGHKLISWLSALTTLGGAGLGAMTGGGGGIGTAINSLVGGVIVGGLVQVLNGTAYNTLRAVQKARLADKITRIGSMQAAQYWTRVMLTQGISGVNKLLSTPDDQLDAAVQK